MTCSWKEKYLGSISKKPIERLNFSRWLTLTVVWRLFFFYICHFFKYLDLRIQYGSEKSGLWPQRNNTFSPEIWHTVFLLVRRSLGDCPLHYPRYWGSRRAGPGEGQCYRYGPPYTLPTPLSRLLSLPEARSWWGPMLQVWTIYYTLLLHYPRYWVCRRAGPGEGQCYRYGLLYSYGDRVFMCVSNSFFPSYAAERREGVWSISQEGKSDYALLIYYFKLFIHCDYNFKFS